MKLTFMVDMDTNKDNKNIFVYRRKRLNKIIELNCKHKDENHASVQFRPVSRIQIYHLIQV